MRKVLFLIALLVVCCVSCERNEFSPEGEEEKVTNDTSSVSFYLLNEGNMGSNKSSLDYFDAPTGTYFRNYYLEQNPNEVMGLGDVGNDLQIYGSKLYAVINSSHKMEVMDASDAKHIAKIDIPNCRYVVGHGGYVYVSSYVGPIQIDPTAPKGAVFKVDTLTMDIVGNVEVGYQPEEMTIIDNKLYVANSGGYRVPNYDNTISVIDLDGFQLSTTLTVEESYNYNILRHDSHGRLWLSSRGDYGLGDHSSDLFVVDPATGNVIKDMDLPVSSMWVDDDIAYVISTEYSKVLGKNNEVSYMKIDMNTMTVLDRNLIKDGTDKNIDIPYSIAVAPDTKDIYVTDAKTYVVSGTLYCFGKDGILKWQKTAGQIPAHFAFKK